MTTFDKNIFNEWLAYFSEQEKWWHLCPVNASIEIKSNKALKKKIENFFWDKEKDVFHSNYSLMSTDYPFEYSSAIEKLREDKKKKYDIIFLDSYRDLTPDELLEYFDYLKKDGIFILNDLSNKSYGSNFPFLDNADFDSFRYQNSYRLKGIIICDNSLLNEAYGSFESHITNIFIFSKSKSEKIFIKPFLGANSEISQINLISNLDKLFLDKKSRWWYDNPWTKENGEPSWSHDYLLDIIIPHLGEFYADYNFEFFDSKKNDEKYLLDNHRESNSINLLDVNFLSNETNEILDILFNHFDYSRAAEAFAWSTHIFSTNYLGKTLVKNFDNVNYQQESIIEFFKINYPDDSEYDMVLKFFEFKKINRGSEPPKNIIIHSNLEKYNCPSEMDIVFSIVDENVNQKLIDYSVNWTENASQIILQLNDRRILEDDDFEVYRQDSLPYLTHIIDLGDYNKSQKDSPSAFIIFNRTKSETFKLIEMQNSNQFNIKRLKIMISDDINILSKGDISSYKKSWKIRESFIEKFKRVIAEIADDGYDISEKPLTSKEFHQRLEKTEEHIVKTGEENTQKIEKHVTKKIDKLTEEIREIITPVLDEIQEIKRMEGDDAEKIKWIVESIDESKIVNKNLDDFIKMVKKWCPNFDKVSDYTKTNLPIAEYLYTDLQNIKGVKDFSSFIAYVSQSIENEILSKVFLEFHKDIRENRTLEERKKICEYDKTLIEGKMKNNIRELDKYFHRYIKGNSEVKYTLGGMIPIIKHLPRDNENISDEYNLLDSLKELKRFIDKNMDSIDKSILDELESFTKTRNKASHPGILSKEEAEEYREKFISLFNLLMDKFK